MVDIARNHRSTDTPVGTLTTPLTGPVPAAMTEPRYSSTPPSWSYWPSSAQATLSAWAASGQPSRWSNARPGSSKQ